MKAFIRIIAAVIITGGIVALVSIKTGSQTLQHLSWSLIFTPLLVLLALLVSDYCRRHPWTKTAIRIIIPLVSLAIGIATLLQTISYAGGINEEVWQETAPAAHIMILMSIAVAVLLGYCPLVLCGWIGQKRS